LLAALYGELGGERVEARNIDDAELVAGLVGDAAANEHLRYGAELVASFGRAIREGYLDVCTDAVAKLTGRRAHTLAEVLGPHLHEDIE
jgi:NAD(P)H dehydrogenase (quinone)